MQVVQPLASLRTDVRLLFLPVWRVRCYAGPKNREHVNKGSLIGSSQVVFPSAAAFASAAVRPKRRPRTLRGAERAEGVGLKGCIES